jgi:hypothetical protein
MTTRFESAPQDAYDMLREVRREHFPELRNAEILILLDKKKRMSGGAIVLGRIQKANDLIKVLTEETVDEGYDYIMYLDKKMWNQCDDADKERVIRHELRHCFVDLDARGTPFKLIGHTIEDFYEEVDLNQDDPRWRIRVAEVIAIAYEDD